jgi:O-antigen/teichoic acid export membrane protein
MSDPSLPSSGSTSAVVRRAMQGALALGTRQALVQAVNFAGGIALTRLLTPAQYGIYGIITFVLGFVGTLGDVGLGASLVRERGEPDERDYRAVFTAQQLLVGVVVIVLWCAAPSIAHAYHLPDRDRWLFRAVAMSLLVTTFQTIPAIRLERHLAFDRLAISEVAQTLVYNATAVGLAFNGFGAESFALAILARAVTGAFVIQLVSRWSFGWLLDWPRIKRHLAFGLPYQGIGAVSLVKDSITPLLIGLSIGTSAVGYVNWAGMIAAYSVQALMIFQRIYLPMFARLQSDRKALGAVVERVVWGTNAITAPLAILTMVLFEPFVTLVFGAKWLVARPLFQLLWLANVFVPTSTPLLGLLSALGDSRIAFGFAVIWMLGTWLAGAPLIALYGSIGFGMANVAVQFTNIALVYVAKRKVPFKVLPTVAPAWTIAALVGALLYAVQRSAPVQHLPGLIGYMMSALSLYVAGIWLFDRRALKMARALLENPR